ncbi:hypothetical protein ABTM68_20295, partial [Acinetobacter baumannii]
PSFVHLAGEALPQWEDGGVTGQLIAGSAYGLKAAAPVFSPLFYADLQLAPGASAELPTGYPERALYVASGAIECAGQAFTGGQMVV